ncbi:hypothetical protein ScPMuIL_003432 [Solemya velum]
MSHQTSFQAVVLTLVFMGVEGLLSLKGPSDKASMEGNDVKFLCSAVPVYRNSPPEPYAIKWKFKSLDTSSQFIEIMTIDVTKEKVVTPSISITNSSKYDNNGMTDLKVKDIQFDDAGTYKCELQGASVTQKEAELFVLRKSSCNGSSENFQVNEKAEYGCLSRYSGSRAPVVSWNLGSKDMNGIQVTHNRTTVVSTVSVPVTAEMNGNVLHCQVSYPDLYAIDCQVLPMKVIYPVFIKYVQTDPFVSRDKLKTFDEGAWVNMYCKAFGNPTPNYNWTYVNATGHTVHLADVSYYRLENIQAENQGNYTCNARNKINGTFYYDKVVTIVSVTTKPKKDETLTVDEPTTRRKQPTLTTTQSSLSNSSTILIDIEGTRTSILSPYAIGALVSAGLAVLLILVFIVLAIKVKSRERKVRNKLSRMHDETLDDQEVELLDENIQPRGEDLPKQYGKVRHHWEIARRDIRLTELKAKGSYVEVWRGRMRKFPNKREIMKIAIKKIVGEATEKERKFFLSEMEVMKMLQIHTNVIKLIGCYTLNEPWLILLEYAPEGTLLQYLHSRRPGHQAVEITVQDRLMARLKNTTMSAHRILALAAQVVSGLDHITKFKLIYYRLQAASILVGCGGICKLSGFGFQQDIAERNLYESSSAPLRWMSLECIEKKVFNVASDIWSFGVVVWEILHFGMTPYPDMGPQEVLEKIKSGYRMPKPPHCSEALYKKVILPCWHVKPDQRPAYREILDRLTTLATQPEENILFDRLPDYLESTEMGDSNVIT